MQTIDQLKDSQKYKLLYIFAKYIFPKITTVEKYADWTGDYYLYDKYDEEIGRMNIEPNNIINVYLDYQNTYVGAKYRVTSLSDLVFEFDSCWDGDKNSIPKYISGTEEEIEKFNNLLNVKIK